MISVIIPLYNKASQIGKTLKGVLNQTYQDFEIIIVNDGSTDKSVGEVNKIDDPRIRLINQPNAGVSAARNRGIKEAHGEFIAFLDADDEWDSDYLACQYTLTEHFPDCTVFASNYSFRDISGNISAPIINGLLLETESGELTNYFCVASAGHPPLWTSAVMVRREAIMEIGGFPVGIKSGEDLLTWARLAARYKIAYSLKPLAIFNVEGYEMKERPKRIPAEKDYVGQELVKLKDEFSPRGINRYISHWHKMRSSIYMRLGMRGKSIREAIIGLRYNLLNYKLFAYIIINMLPSKFQPF